MISKLKTILVISAFLIGLVLCLIIFGLYLMNDEDKYGNLVYFNQKVENGDIIFRSKYSEKTGLETDFNEFGTIEKSLDKVYVWDKQNTLKQNLYVWASKGNGQRVKVFRKKDSDFEINESQLKNGTYHHLMNSDSLEFITEN